MDVILKEDYPSLGYVGDKVSVRGGFARNFLIPRGLAIESSSRNSRVLNHKLGAIQAKRVKLRGQAQEFAQRLAEVKLEFTLKAGSGGRTFGSVTVRDIVVALEKKGVQLDRRQVRLTESVRGAGEYTAEIKLHSEVVTPLNFLVIAERVVKEASAEVEEGGRKRGKGRKTPEVSAEGDVAAEGAEELQDSDEEASEE